MKQLKFGISMRLSSAVGYDEKRDAIARDWYAYMQYTWPDAQWLLIPNIGTEVTDYIKKWGINAIILTGGEDYGTDSLRDETEKAIYFFATKNNIPILGVCRGFQIMCLLNNLELKKSDTIAKTHVATSHEVYFKGEKIIVNSYHTNYIDDLSKADEHFDEIGIANDNTLEAIYKPKLMGIMWHPERQNKSQDMIDKILKEFFYETQY